MDFAKTNFAAVFFNHVCSILTSTQQLCVTFDILLRMVDKGLAKRAYDRRVHSVPAHDCFIKDENETQGDDLFGARGC